MAVHFSSVKVVAAAVVLAGALVCPTGCGIENTCAYGRSSHSATACKPRPEPTPEETAAMRNGSSFSRALDAFRRSEDGNRRLVGIGMNRWGEVSFALPTGETGFGAELARYVHFDARGQSITQNSRGGTLESPAGAIEFAIDDVQPEVLRDTLAKIGATDRFLRAHFQTTFGNTGIGWTLSYAAPVGGGNGAMFAMAADGGGLCRMNEGARPADVPACTLGRLPTAAVATTVPAMPSAPAVPAAPNPETQKQIDRLACVQKAAGDVAALQRCVQ